MRVRRFCLCLSLLASLGAAGAAPATAGSGLRAGAVPFPIDAAGLAGQICGEDDPAEKKSNVECHAIVKNEAIVSGLTLGDASPLRMRSAEPLVTSCGLWEATLTLDPVRLRAVTQEVFTEVSEDPSRSVSAMVLEMSTNLHLANLETGEAVDFVLRPGRGARWRLARTGRSPRSLHLAGESEEENKVLTFEGCIPVWVYDDPNLEVVKEPECGICPAEEEEPQDLSSDGEADGDSVMTSMDPEPRR